jgi:hypothetical protein
MASLEGRWPRRLGRSLRGPRFARAPQDDGSKASILILTPRFSRASRQIDPFIIHPRRTQGPFSASLHHRDKGKRNADRRGVEPSAPVRCGSGQSCPLACRRPTAALAEGTYVDPRRNSGQVSWDVAGRGLPAAACPSPANTSRAGRSAGGRDAQAARRRAVSSRPRAPHSPRLPQIPSRKASCTERVSVM